MLDSRQLPIFDLGPYFLTQTLFLQFSGDGNCFLHSLKDQLSYDNSMDTFLKELKVQELRILICNQLEDMIRKDQNFFPECEVKLGKRILNCLADIYST